MWWAWPHMGVAGGVARWMFVSGDVDHVMWVLSLGGIWTDVLLIMELALYPRDHRDCAQEEAFFGSYMEFGGNWWKNSGILYHQKQDKNWWEFDGNIQEFRVNESMIKLIGGKWWKCLGISYHQKHDQINRWKMMEMFRNTAWPSLLF